MATFLPDVAAARLCPLWVKSGHQVNEAVARVLAWLVKICEGRETTKPTMPPEIAEYVTACIAYDQAWPLYRKDDAHRAAHDSAMERLDKAEAVIVKKQVQTEWDAFGRMLVLARVSLGGSDINDEDWQNFGREWADALGAPEVMAVMDKVG